MMLCVCVRARVHVLYAYGCIYTCTQVCVHFVSVRVEARG